MYEIKININIKHMLTSLINNVSILDFGITQNFNKNHSPISTKTSLCGLDS